MTEHQTKLTSSEIASIWSCYMNETVSNCILGYLLKHVEDARTKYIVQSAFDSKSTRIEKLTNIFEKEELPIPTGFTNHLGQLIRKNFRKRKTRNTRNTYIMKSECI